MFEWLTWFTRLDNSKIFSLVLFLTAFCAIVVYVYTGKRRGERLESYKHIPFQDEYTETVPRSSKVMDDDRH